VYFSACVFWGEEGSTDLLLTDNLTVEKLLDFLITEVDGELLDRIDRENLKTRNIKDANKRDSDGTAWN
jgi:hypothetical protein